MRNVTVRMGVLPKEHVIKRGAIKSVIAAETAALEGNVIALAFANIAVK